ncbi:MAG: sigma-70 family RNA polymerase sigma factor [Clostridia bacterium]|nr:sigma-70 family RNA polymerase sigma factor [Clostridia bacterium]
MTNTMQGPAWTVDRLIDTYGDELLRLCLLYMGDRQLAEDAFQETMIKAWRALPKFRGESSIKTWLFHIAVNTCRDMLRSSWMRMRKNSVPLDVVPELAEQERDDLRDLISSVLALPAKYREVIVLFYYKEMKIREIADVLHLPQASVSSRLRRARAKLKIDMEGETTHEK